MDNYTRACYFCLFLLLLFISCNNKEKQVTKSYYYWRTETYLGDEEKKFLKQHSINKLYSKLMDIDWSEVYGAYPVTSNNVDEINYNINVQDSVGASVVPVIFITNKTFQKIDSADIPLLAKRVVRRCLPRYDSIDIRYEERNTYSSYGDTYKRLIPQEIQFDCDWTLSTAKSYFSFLKEVRALLPHDSIKISTTIRLHQYKYPDKTGVPPVDRGMLMVYNISDLTQYAATNSIFDKDKAKAYFTNSKKYPLAMDIALPAYSWCIVYRNKKFYQLENQLSEEELKKLTFLKPAPNHFYRVTHDTVFNDLFLRRGDEIKAESIDKETLQHAMKLAKKAVNSDSFSVALFELSENEIKNYSYETIEAVYASYR